MRDSTIRILRSERGSLEKPLERLDWWRPRRVWIQGERLYYDQSLRVDERPIDLTNMTARAGTGVVLRFTRLHASDDEEIAEFARKRGTLRLCEHGLPATHNPAWTADRGIHARCAPQGIEPYELWEPLDRWRVFSRKAEALLGIAGCLHRDVKPPPRVWLDAWGVTAEERDQMLADPRFEVTTVQDQKEWLAGELGRWLDLADARPRMRVSDTGLLQLTITGYWLFGWLASQLLLICSHASGLASCSVCGKLHMPDRKPARNRHCYCQECRQDRSAHVFSVRESAAKKRAAAQRR